MTEQVVYELGLRDKLSAGIQGATGHVNMLEKSLSSVSGLLTGIGVGLAAFKLAEFAHEANEAWDKMEFSMSQVKAGLESTQGAAGLTFDELKKGAEETSHSIKFTQSEILGLQSVLLTFPAVTKETFGEATAIIADMSTRLGTDLKSSAIQVGKALQDPEHGITALRKAGVNFTKDQQELIKSLVNTNRAAEAQAMIINELKTEFGGSALAAAEADKSFRLDKTMEENKVILGEFIDQIKEEMLPVLISIANGFKSMIIWVKENWEGIKNLTKALGAAWLAFKIIGGASAILQALGLASGVAATGLSSMGVAATSALGPLGLIAAAIGGIVYAYDMWTDAQERRKKSDADFRTLAQKDTDTFLKEQTAVLEKQGIAHDKAVERAKEMYGTQINALQASSYEQHMAAEKGSEAEKIARARLTYANDAINALSNYKDEGLIPKKAGGLQSTSTTTSDKVKSDPKTKATGSKSVTINVSIKELVHDLNVNTTNLREGATKIKDAVVAALTGAVNDFQIVAGGQ